MEYQKITNLLENTSSEPFKVRTKNWVEINDESRGIYNVNRQIKFKTTTLILIYMIMLIHTYLLKEKWQLIIYQLQVLLQIILTKK